MFKIPNVNDILAPPPTKEGFLTKLGYMSGKWQQRWFKLVGNELSYAAQRGGNSKGKIFVNSSCQVDLVDAASPISNDALIPGKAAKTPVPQCTFKITTPYKQGTRTYYLVATNEADRQQWISCLAALVSSAAPQQQQGGLQGLMQMSQQLSAQQQQTQQPNMGELMGLLGQAQQLSSQMQQPQQQQQQQDPMAALGQLQGLNLGSPTSGGLMQQQQAMMGMPMQQQQHASSTPAPPPSYQQSMSTPPPAISEDFGPQAKGGERPSPPPETSTPLPPFPQALDMQGLGSGNKQSLTDLLKMSGNIMGAMKSHKNDPHLSKQDNANALADKVGAATGQGSHEEQLLYATRILASEFLPQGLRGIVVTAQPGPGTLGQEHGLKPYDLVFEAEGEPYQSIEGFHASRNLAFATKGEWTVGVYNFQTREYRDVVIKMPPGKPNAILGIQASPVPPPSEELLQAARDAEAAELYVKGWRKRGAMFVSSGNEYFPVSGPRTPNDMDVYIKPWRKAGIGMVSTNEYHPLYNYSGDPGVFVKAWRSRSGMMVSSNDYTPLPPR